MADTFKPGRIFRRQVKTTVWDESSGFRVHVGPEALFEQLSPPDRSGCVQMRVVKGNDTTFREGTEFWLAEESFRRLVPVAKDPA